MNKEDKDFLILEIAKSNLIKKGGLIYSGDLKDFIDQLEETEQEKVVIPQFVGDFIDEMKHRNKQLPLILYGVYIEAKKVPDIFEWVWKNEKNNNAFARAWLYGYSVEKEPQWVVKDDTGYLSYLRFSIPDIYERETSLDKNDAYKFNSKSKAYLIADLVTGTVEEITK